MRPKYYCCWLMGRRINIDLTNGMAGKALLQSEFLVDPEGRVCTKKKGHFKTSKKFYEKLHNLGPGIHTYEEGEFDFFLYPNMEKKGD